MKPDHELLTVSQMGQADAAAIAAGTPSTQLMQHAGEAVVRVVMNRTDCSLGMAVMVSPERRYINRIAAGRRPSTDSHRNE